MANTQETVIRRINTGLDKEILRVQSELIKQESKPISYPQASKFYAQISFNGRTNLMEAIKKMDKRM